VYIINYSLHNITGPFRFLGVIPNEDSAEKEVKDHPSTVRGRGDLGRVTSATVENADTETTSSRRGPHIRRYKRVMLFVQQSLIKEVLLITHILLHFKIFKFLHN
jgi:hypothetical protein